MCKRNAGNRNNKKDKHINQHSGPLALSYRAEALEREGHKALKVQAFIYAYAPNKNAAEKVAAVKRKMEEVLGQQDDIVAEDSGEVVSREILPLDTQIGIIEDQMGIRPGTSIRGVGSAITCKPKRRGGARLSDNAAETKELKRQLEEAKAVAVEKTEQLSTRMEQMEAFIQAFQAGQTNVVPTSQSSCASLGMKQDLVVKWT